MKHLENFQNYSINEEASGYFKMTEYEEEDILESLEYIFNSSNDNYLQKTTIDSIDRYNKGNFFINANFFKKFFIKKSSTVYVYRDKKGHSFDEIIVTRHRVAVIIGGMNILYNTYIFGNPFWNFFQNNFEKFVNKNLNK